MAHFKRSYVLWAVLLGTSEVGFLYLLASHIPMTVWDYILFPGVAVGSVLFGHSVGMFYAGIATNVLFYSALTLGAMVFLSRNTS
jgi:hypothetical protein